MRRKAGTPASLAGWEAMADRRRPHSETLNTPQAPGAPSGDFGAPEDELLVDGQEEVFSRSEVESGRIEHQAEAGGDAGPEAE